MRHYSLGMRQRLGIATALLGDPEVLILDEPANGLDPAGIRWMRDLLRGYADQGGTVLLSSHLLHEIEVVADDLVVIGNGRIVAQGTKSELLASAGTLVRTRTPRMRPRSPPCIAHAAVVGGRRRALRVEADADRVGSVALDGPHPPPQAARPPRGPASRSCSSSSPPTTSERPRTRPNPRSPQGAAA